MKNNCKALRPLRAIAFLLLAATGCTPVAFYEKEALANPIMSLDPGPTQVHFYQKVYYSIEGSVGGIGTNAGGGCGCY